MIDYIRKNRKWVLLIIIIIIIIVVTFFVWNRIEDANEDIPTGKTMKAITYLAPRSKSSKLQLIPRIIMQTNEKNEIPGGMAAAIMSIIEANPEYEYRYFDNSTARHYLKRELGTRYLDAFDTLRAGAFKADFFRYCFLYKSGGVYLDTGMEAVKPLSGMIKSDDKFVSPEDDGKVGIYNAMMASIPGHPILKRAIDMCLDNIENRKKGDNTLSVTGPDLLAAAFEDVMKTNVVPNGEYRNGVRLIYHRSGNASRVAKPVPYGLVFDNDIIFFRTKYPNYSQEMKWYHTNPHYSQLWYQDNIYN